MVGTNINFVGEGRSQLEGILPVGCEESANFLIVGRGTPSVEETLIYMENIGYLSDISFFCYP